MEMSGLKELSTNIEAPMAMKAKASPRWVKMKRFPSARSAKRAFTVPSRLGAGGREMTMVASIAAEKTKLATSSQKQAFSVSQETSAPASAGERMRTM